MAWSDKDEARKVYKFMKSGILEPEDLKHNEVRVLRQHYPGAYSYVKRYLEDREKRIEEGEWSMDDEPPDFRLRISRYEQGNGVVDVWDGRED